MTNNDIGNPPQGFNTVNPFIITKNAEKQTVFLENVFRARRVEQAMVRDTDGLVLHSEVTIGNSNVAIVDTKPGWPFTPSLLQVYVSDARETLRRAERSGARIVTEPTEVFGTLFSRFIDPWGNLWWVYEHLEDVTWDAEAESTETSHWEPTKEMTYIHETLLTAMKRLAGD